MSKYLNFFKNKKVSYSLLGFTGLISIMTVKGRMASSQTKPNIHPEGEKKKLKTKMLEMGTALMQSKAPMKDFNTYNAFALFDVEKKGVINNRQLEQGFERLSLHFTKGDVALLMKRLDTDLDGQLKFGDFSHAITPKSAEFAKLMGSREPYYVSELENIFEAFTEETMDAFKSFLRALVEEETLCESIRQRLVKRKGFNLHDAFNALDRYNKSFITAEEFKEILEENGCFFSQKDVNTLVEKYTKANKGKVSYYDFIREMTIRSQNVHLSLKKNLQVNSRETNKIGIIRRTGPKRCTIQRRAQHHEIRP